jgi:hypothetical protein
MYVFHHVLKSDVSAEKAPPLVGGIEGAFGFRVHDVDVLVVEFSVLHHHYDGGQCVVNVALVAEAILLVDEDAVGLCVFRACIFY